MLKFLNNKFYQIPATDLKNNSILERSNLQKAIVNCWETFIKEIGMPDLYLIGEEIIPHDSVSDRIDILAFDPNDSIPVVFELKRDKNKFQLLQAITYSAMINSWNKEQFLINAKSSPDFEDLKNIIESTEISKDVRIVLLSERFEPEVIIASNWLYEQYNLDVTAISINTFKKDDDLYFSFDQKFPLYELQDTYDARRSTKRKVALLPDISWEDVALELNYEWGKDLLNMCRKEKDGEAARRRMGMFRKNFDGFNWITLNFRNKHLNIYIKGKPEDAKNLLESKFRDKIEINSWRDGYSIAITTKREFEDLCKWLKISKTNREAA